LTTEFVPADPLPGGRDAQDHAAEIVGTVIDGISL
jgi:hypothetical protein